jgi:uncharacterized membrane protein
LLAARNLHLERDWGMGESETGSRSTETQVVDTIEAVLALRARQQGHIGRQQRLVERITESLGQPRTVYVTLTAVAAWIVYNIVAAARGWPVFDAPPFGQLQGVVSLDALLMTTMVLTTQNRQARHAEQSAHLDLQVSLLAEQKIAKVIALIEELRRDLPNVHDRRDTAAEAMSKAVDPNAVISAIEKGRP